jgi:hypothetical protein
LNSRLPSKKIQRSFYFYFVKKFNGADVQGLKIEIINQIERIKNRCTNLGLQINKISTIQIISFELPIYAATE